MFQLSMPGVNINRDTGIRYGAISQNSLSMDAISDWYDNDRVYDSAREEVISTIKVLDDLISLSEDTKDTILQEFNDNYQNDYQEFYFKDDQYSAEYMPSMKAWLITKSPYYTFCRFCSPCVPNAGDLDSPEDEVHGVKTYCLPAEFFDPEYPAPYQIIREV